MKKIAFITAAAAAAIALPSAAQAQDVVPGNGFIGVQAGVHDLGLDDELEDIGPGLELDDSSPIFGVFAGYDVPVGPALFIGAEANYNFGTDALDGDYGANARLGFSVPGGAKIYGRAGIQAIKVDYSEIINDDSIDFDGIDDTESDYLVGIGADVPVGRAFVRGNLDTISFDTMRATVGVGLRF
ncbi:outer membrane beta-barrel protein [Qipengyuania sp. XHP0211]|uniref:outer membrane protein n=1 Tax=Qipengyuania sp. XHP0211 TaxID=3038079 RepID=UPI00242046C4|nr:outer membrane beta-barrel protein [Qipengyuania sp. XHP0211]MDG5751372.1 outer membrane beta-barrel protein [Qipengyuania sp. XHP0211]